MSEEAFIYEAIRTPRGKEQERLAARGQAGHPGHRPHRRAAQPLPRPGRGPDQRPHPRRASRRSATRARTSPAPPPSWPACPTRSAASSSTASAPRASRPSTSPRRRCAPAGTTWSSPAASSRCRRVPMGSDGGAWAMDPETTYDTYFVPQGIGADLIATIEGFSREDVDAYAVRSQERAAAAWTGGYFAKSVVPVKDQNGLTVLDHDEHMRPDTTVESLGKLKPAFAGIGEMGGFDAVALQKYHYVEKINHVHTGGNCSGIVDGAALVLVGSEEAGKAQGLTPRARIVATATSGADPTIMLTGPTPATQQGARPRRPDGRRHRPVRAERGVRVGGAEVPEGPEHPRREAQRQRRRHRHGPPARRHRRHDHRHHGRRARAPQRAAARSSRCASAAAWASPPSSSGSEAGDRWQRTRSAGTRTPTASSR